MPTVSLSKCFGKKRYSTMLCTFAETLLQCIQTPQNINEYIKNYYESSDYCPVGSDDNHAYTLFDEINNTLLKVGLTAFVFSFVTLPFSMPIGLIVLGISLAVMLPTAFYALVETIPNQTKIKKEEKALFTELYSCLNSENVTNSPELEVRVDQPATA